MTECPKVNKLKAIPTNWRKFCWWRQNTHLWIPKYFQ